MTTTNTLAAAGIECPEVEAYRYCSKHACVARGVADAAIDALKKLLDTERHYSTEALRERNKARDALDAAEAERDALRAENEALRSDSRNYWKLEAEKLRAENARLRKVYVSMQISGPGLRDARQADSVSPPPPDSQTGNTCHHTETTYRNHGGTKVCNHCGAMLVNDQWVTLSEQAAEAAAYYEEEGEG